MRERREQRFWRKKLALAREECLIVGSSREHETDRLDGALLPSAPPSPFEYVREHVFGNISHKHMILQCVRHLPAPKRLTRAESDDLTRDFYGGDQQLILYCMTKSSFGEILESARSFSPEEITLPIVMYHDVCYLDTAEFNRSRRQHPRGHIAIQGKVIVDAGAAGDCTIHPAQSIDDALRDSREPSAAVVLYPGQEESLVYFRRARKGHVELCSPGPNFDFFRQVVAAHAEYKPDNFERVRFNGLLNLTYAWRNS